MLHLCSSWGAAHGPTKEMSAESFELPHIYLLYNHCSLTRTGYCLRKVDNKTNYFWNMKR